METENKYVNATKSRVTTIRLRTWSITLAIVVTLVLYFLVNLVTKQKVNPIDFCLLCAVQIIIYTLYFPDGDLFGQKDKAFINNKETYNTKASEINANKEISKLRAYCHLEYEQRKKRYILNECGAIGITLEELEILKQLTAKKIKKMRQYMFIENEVSKTIVFSKKKAHRLYKLVYDELPVKENSAETIMSAVENSGNEVIKDQSVVYKTKSYIRKILMAVVVGGFFAYVGNTLKDGIGLSEVVSICMYLTTLITTAVMAFSAGEQCSRVYKSHFYVDLINFIDGFKEWQDVQFPTQPLKEEESV